VVVHQIHIVYVAGFEPEHDAPITADADASKPFQTTLQRMQAVSGKVNVPRMERRVEMGQHIGNALALIRPELGGVPSPETDALRPCDGTSVS